MNVWIKLLAAAVALTVMSGTSSYANTVLFYDDFEAGIGNWTQTRGPAGGVFASVGNGNVGGGISLLGGNSIPNPDNSAATTSAFGTLGFTQLAVSFNYAGVNTEGIVGNDDLQLFASFDGNPFVAITNPVNLVLACCGQASGDPGLPWTLYSAIFNAPSSSNMKLEIRMNGSLSSDIARVDNVRIEGISAVPLPAALPLFATGIGALGLAGWSRKRRRAKAALA